MIKKIVALSILIGTFTSMQIALEHTAQRLKDVKVIPSSLTPINGEIPDAAKIATQLANMEDRLQIIRDDQVRKAYVLNSIENRLPRFPRTKYITLGVLAATATSVYLEQEYPDAYAKLMKEPQAMLADFFTRSKAAVQAFINPAPADNAPITPPSPNTATFAQLKDEERIGADIEASRREAEAAQNTKSIYIPAAQTPSNESVPL
jgi:hypothetical protein